jgi:hypothetical protein
VWSGPGKFDQESDFDDLIVTPPRHAGDFPRFRHWLYETQTLFSEWGLDLGKQSQESFRRPSSRERPTKKIICRCHGAFSHAKALSDRQTQVISTRREPGRLMLSRLWAGVSFIFDSVIDGSEQRCALQGLQKNGDGSGGLRALPCSHIDI